MSITCRHAYESTYLEPSGLVSWTDRDTAWPLTYHLRPRRILTQQGASAVVRQPAPTRKRNEKYGNTRNAETIKQHLGLEAHRALLPRRYFLAEFRRGPAVQRHSKWGPGREARYEA